MADAPYRRIHVVVNPASGKDEPVLNVLNDVFHRHGVDWNVSITKKYGDAAVQAKAALADGVDLVVGYGGDGTRHELANAVLEVADAVGGPARIGILPGTGNGFAREMGVPGTLREATEVLCQSDRLRSIDVGRLVEVGNVDVPDRYFIQRLYVGVEPEEQTSREMKDRYGVFAYAVNLAHRGPAKEVSYRAVVDGEPSEFHASRVYVVNSGMMGTGLRITHEYSVDDGLLDAFAIDGHTRDTIVAAASRFLDLHTASASRYHRQCRTLRIETTPDQPIWADGEYIGRTPVSIEVSPRALSVVVP